MPNVDMKTIRSLFAIGVIAGVDALHFFSLGAKFSEQIIKRLFLDI
ncbi:MAG: hypothetical protein WDO15_17390 [Bacteroidota bacterium]